MVRILGSTGSRRRRRYQLAALFSATALLAALAALPAQAIHNADDTSLELDGNVLDSPAGAPDDWSNVFAGNDGADFTTGIVNDPLGASIFTGAQSGGSSKDNQDISGWRWKCGSVPDKDEISNFAASLYTVGIEKRLYFMSDRFSNGGTSHIGVWFFRNTIDTVPSNPGAGCGPAARTFSDVHVARSAGPDGILGNADDERGDILVLSDFTQGGTIANLKIFEWVGAGGDQKGGTLNQIGVSVDCVGLSHPPSAEACATVNSGLLSGADGPPWTYSPKTGAAQTYPAGSFFEGGVDLNAFGLGGECFGATLSETRSSAEVDAVLKDFVITPFEECQSSTVTTPKDGSGGDIPAGGLSIGTGSVTAKDRAVVTGAGGTGGAPVPTGKVKFYICGPAATDAAAQCPAAPSTTGLTQIGAAAGEDLVATGDPSEAAVTSAAATLTSVGHYCWRADYLGDGNYPADPVTGVASSDNSLTECFTVNPVTPTLTTQASGPVTLGNAISDTASLTGTANQPGTGGGGTDGSINPTTPGDPADGTITFTAFGPNNCSTVAFGPTDVTVSGNNTSYGPVSFTPTAVGTYTFVASYSGDSPNTNGVPATACPDTTGTETVTVTDTSSVTSAQNWLPNDEATVTSAGGSSLNGTLTFTLFETADCTGDAVAGQTYTRTLVDASSPATRSTDNTTYLVTANKSVSWLVAFDSSNPDVSDAAPVCETTSLTIDNDVPIGP